MNVTIIGGVNNEYCYKKLDVEFQKEIETSQFFLFNILFFREPLDPTRRMGCAKRRSRNLFCTKRKRNTIAVYQKIM